MNLVIAANCHVQPLASGLNILNWTKKIHSIPIHLFNTPHFEKAVEKFNEIENFDDHYILTFATSDSFGYFETVNLKNKHPNVYTMTNIYFSGLHPDITYLGVLGKRIESPAGDYHSKIILSNYLKGASCEECLLNFNYQTYEVMSFFEEFAKSKNDLIKRDELIDIPFAKVFFESIHEQPSLYTVNHPTPFVFQNYIELIAKFFNQTSTVFPVGMLHNYLSHSTWWPIYPEIAEYHNLKFKCPMLFKQPDYLGGKTLTLSDMIHKSYLIYAKLGDSLKNIQNPLL